MVLECFTKIIKGDSDDSSSNVIKKNTSTKFPSKTDHHLHWLRNIYNKWRILASSPHHHLLVGYICRPRRVTISIIDVKTTAVREANGLKEFTEDARFLMSNSCNGLVLLTYHNPTHQHVFNPLSNKVVTRVSPACWGGDPCAFFYHPLAKEYRILNVRETGDMAFPYEYHIYLFGTKTWRRTFNPEYFRRPTETIDGLIIKVNGKATVTSEALYWLLWDIMVFDIITEECHSKDLPGSYTKEAFYKPKLLAREDRLCCCYVDRQEPVMFIWVLEDYASWSWDRKYVVDLDWDMTKYPLITNWTLGPYILRFVTVVSIRKDEVVVLWKNRGMFSYHLGLNTVEKIPLRDSEMDNYLITDHSLSRGFMPYTAASGD